MTGGFVGHRLVAGEEAGQSADIAGALGVVLGAEWAEAASREVEVAQQELQIDQAVDAALGSGAGEATLHNTAVGRFWARISAA